MRNKKDTIYKIYIFVKDYIETNKFSPTYSHMNEVLKYSEGTISNTINYLVKKMMVFQNVIIIKFHIMKKKLENLNQIFSIFIENYGTIQLIKI